MPPRNSGQSMYKYINVDGTFINKDSLSAEDTLRYASTADSGTTPTLSLPFPGEYCVQSNFHQKWKIFDPPTGKVTTVYGDTYDENRVLQEIQASLSASRLEIAPRVFDYSVQDKWITEELIHGKELWPVKWDEARTYYTEHLNVLIAEIIKGSPITKVRALDYVLPKVKAINGFFQASSHLTPVSGRILEFVDDVSKQIIEHYANETVLLVATHGDFKFSHVILTDRGPRVIDWETIGTRSVLFDFLNPICPWLIHHEITRTEGKEFSLIMNSFCQHFERISDALLVTELKNNWLQYKLLFCIERMARILEIKGLTRQRIEKGMNRTIEGCNAFNKKIDIEVRNDSQKKL